MSSRAFIVTVALAVAGVLSSAFAQAPDGKALFEEHCMECHGADGTPPRAMKKKFPKVARFDTAFVASHSADSVVKILTRGKGEDMLSFRMKLKPDEMAAVAKYVLELGSKNKS